MVKTGTGKDDEMSRRAVLGGIGAGAVASVGFAGTATGHEVQGPPVFCGCSQVCVCVDGRAGVLVARETDDGYEVGFAVDEDTLDPYPDPPARFEGNFCVSVGEEVPDGKIIGLQVSGTRWVNPNQCAQKALAAEREQIASDHPRPEGEAGGPCGKPPCEHPGRGGRSRGRHGHGKDGHGTGGKSKKRGHGKSGKKRKAKKGKKGKRGRKGGHGRGRGKGGH